MKLLAIDGNSIINRAFYGMRPLSNGDGFPTHAIFGFLTIMQRMVEELQPDALCVCFDRKEKTFRHEAYEGYKAQRQPMPEDLALQLPKVKEVLDAMNIPRFELAGWEADDLLGTLAARCEDNGWHCIIATGDKDALQLITEKTYIYLISSRMGKTTSREMDYSVFFEEYGFPPVALVDLKALMGDASDNIPGVKGIGEKTGKTLIARYGSIQALYDDLEQAELTPSVRKKLTEGREMAFFSFGLCTIQTNAPMEVSLEACLRKPVNQSALYEIFSQLEFYKLIEQMGLHALQGDAPAVEEEEEPPCLFEELQEDALAFALLETWKVAEQISVLPLPGMEGLAVACDGAVFLMFAQSLPAYEAIVREIFSEKVSKVAHGVKTVMKRLLDAGYPMEGFVFDTELAAYLLAPTDGSYELPLLAKGYFPKGAQLPEGKVFLSDTAFSPLDQNQVAKEALAAHVSAMDKLALLLAERLDELHLRGLFDTIELPLCAVLARMEQAGFLVDRQALKTFGEGLKSRIAQTESQIHELAGEHFNVNSTQQLGVILFDKLGLPTVKKTKTGHSTSVEVLEKLQGMHPIIDLIMAYRQLTKLNSTYVEGLGRVIGDDGRIHTSFQNTVTATGRLSSTEPNLQNIPVRTPLGAQMRRMFVAEPGQVLVDADYSQIELRLLAHIAQDQTMIDAFRQGEDIHRSTAAQVFGLPPEDVTAELRRRAKAVNFGIVYGMSEFSLAQDIGVGRKEAGAYMERYFDSFHGVRDYMHDIVQKAKQDGFVTSLYGRRRWLPELSSSNYNLRAFGERVALNMPIQGTAADIMKLAMLRVDARLQREGLAARLILQVHDELIVECPREEATRVQGLLEEEMAAAAQLSIPLLAEAAVGESWAEAKG